MPGVTSAALEPRRRHLNRAFTEDLDDRRCDAPQPGGRRIVIPPVHNDRCLRCLGKGVKHLITCSAEPVSLTPIRTPEAVEEGFEDCVLVDERHAQPFAESLAHRCLPARRETRDHHKARLHNHILPVRMTPELVAAGASAWIGNPSHRHDGTIRGWIRALGRGCCRIQ